MDSDVLLTGGPVPWKGDGATHWNILDSSHHGIRAVLLHHVPLYLSHARRTVDVHQGSVQAVCGSMQRLVRGPTTKNTHRNTIRT